MFLLVFCPTGKVAQDCAEPIRMGHPGLVLKPLTFHPGDLPPVTDPERARKYPTLTILSAPSRFNGPDRAVLGVS